MLPPSSQEPLVSIIIPVFNLWEYTRRCLMSVVKHTSHIPHEVIVVDDASTDETREALPLINGICCIRNERNQGFSRNNNQAAQIARGKYLLFLNNDTEVHARWLDEMLSVIEARPEVGMVGSKLLFPDGTIQHGGVAFSYGAPVPISPFHIHYREPASESTLSLELNAVTAACALMPRQLFLSLGGFDEGFRMGYEDVDLCLRVRVSGHKIVYTPLSVVTHYESLSPGRFVASRRNLELLNRKWLGRLEAFESDYRKLAQPTKRGAQRPPCSVVVAAHDDLWWVAPCLENVWVDLGEQDELILVDDGSVGATAIFLHLFARRHANRTRLIRHETYQGLAGAWRTGLQAATKPYAVALVCSTRVISGWLDRMILHLTTNKRLGALTVTFADAKQDNLLAPIPAEQGGLALPRPSVPGEVRTTRFLLAAVVAAERDRLLRLTTDHPEGVPGAHPQLWSRALESEGLVLSLATDVTVCRINQLCAPSTDSTREIYFESVVKALDQRDPMDALVSVIVVARDFQSAALATIEALLCKTTQRFELIVVDDGSQHDLRGPVEREIRKSRPRNLVGHQVLRNEAPEGFPAAINQGLAASRGDVLVVMNGDVVVTPQWLVRLSALLKVSSALGVAAPVSNCGPAPQSCELPNSLDPPMPLDQFAEDRAANFLGEFGGIPRVAGICLAIRRDVLDAIGGFDPSYADAGGDVEDFCLRATRKGFLIGLAREVYVEHLGCLPQRWLDLHPRRPAPAGWLQFCQRWDHRPEWSDTEGLSKVFSSKLAFNASTDYVPLSPAPAKVASSA